MYKIRINNEVYFAEDGTLLSEVLTKNSKDMEHLCGGKGICKKCSVIVNGRQELSCKYIIASDITVEIPEKQASLYMLEECFDVEGEENTCLVLDIGTTTLALALVCLTRKKIIRSLTVANPQRIYGADVMSRIEYCTKNGVKTLHKSLVSQINLMIDEIKAPLVENMFVAGNVTMLHTFFGEDCSSIGVAPYTPRFLEGKRVSAESLCIKNVSFVESLPSIHSFVGADIVAGLEFAQMPADNKYNLLVDLGTNAEIVLFNKDSVLCTSAAAGPCFEGANISCGMGATTGAIYSYSSGVIKTIGNKPPCGICGSGLVDVIAELIKRGKIDATGYMEKDFSVAYGVTLTQGDVREYQLAKSAVYSAIVTLLNECEITFDDIEKVYVSGGFSQGMNIENAIYTGLLPMEFKDKCICVGNSSLYGLVEYAFNKKFLKAFEGKYIDLSQNNFFAEEFIKNMEVRQ